MKEKAREKEKTRVEVERGLASFTTSFPLGSLFSFSFISIRYVGFQLGIASISVSTDRAYPVSRAAPFERKEALRGKQGAAIRPSTGATAIGGCSLSTTTVTPPAPLSVARIQLSRSVCICIVIFSLPSRRALTQKHRSRLRECASARTEILRAVHRRSLFSQQPPSKEREKSPNRSLSRTLSPPLSLSLSLFSNRRHHGPRHPRTA